MSFLLINVYKILFSERKEICANLNFDKSLSLSGYPITIADNNFFYDASVKNPYKFRTTVGKTLKEIFSPLQPKIHIRIVSQDTFSINQDGTKIGSSLVKILNGTFDMRAATENQHYFGDFWRNELNLFIKTGICYAVADTTASWGEYFQQNNFLPMFVSVMYVCLIAEAIIKLFKKPYKVNIVMDLLRASIGNATLWEPKESFKRIIFLLIIIPFIIITSFLQSELTSFVSVTPKNEIEIETIDDLIKKKYEVFTLDEIRQIFISTPFYRHVRTPDQGCYDSLEKNVSRACAQYCVFLENIARLPENVKVIRDIYLQGYRTYTFPVDYPILPRLRKIYYELHEAGIITRIFKQHERGKTEKDRTFSDSTLDELRYVFYFMMLGSLLSAFVFLIEIASFEYFRF